MVSASPDGNVSLARVVVDTEMPGDALAVQSLKFAYPGAKPVIDDFSLHLPAGSRCLLLGANGAGKSTLLQIIAGHHMHGRDAVRVLGRPAFHDIELVASGDLTYLGHQWRKDVSCAGYDIALQGDLEAGKMIFGVEGVDLVRRQRLIDLLDVNLDWRMNKVSDGQRRRVQICMGLLKPFKVCCMDEICVDMDVVGRLDLLGFLKQECEERGATIIYCTHITDGLTGWLTHLAYVERGILNKGGPVADIPELHQNEKLLHTVERWLRAERETRPKEVPSAPRSAPAFANRHMAFYR